MLGSVCLDFWKSTIRSMVFDVFNSRLLFCILSDAESPPCRLTHFTCYQSYDGHVIGRFDNGIGGVNGRAVIGEEGAEEGAEDTPCVI